MQEHIRRRVLDIATHIITSGSTVRQTALVFEVSKSTVHKDMTERLPDMDEDLASRVRAILEQNKAERHIRGGEATRKKYRGEDPVPCQGLQELAATSTVSRAGKSVDPVD